MTRMTLTHRYSRSVEIATESTLVMLDAGLEHPILPFDDQSIDSVDAIDVIEHVTDEEAWLRECCRVLIPGGMLRLQLPRQGMTSWFESLNIYRYSVDVLGIGHEPREIYLTGWHRQYTERDVRMILEKSGFSVQHIDRHSIGLAEVPTLGRLIVGDLVRNDRATGKRVKSQRAGLDLLDSRLPVGLLSRRLLATAIANQP